MLEPRLGEPRSGLRFDDGAHEQQLLSRAVRYGEEEGAVDDHHERFGTFLTRYRPDDSSQHTAREGYADSLGSLFIHSQLSFLQSRARRAPSGMVTADRRANRSKTSFTPRSSNAARTGWVRHFSKASVQKEWNRVTSARRKSLLAIGSMVMGTAVPTFRDAQSLTC